MLRSLQNQKTNLNQQNVCRTLMTKWSFRWSCKLFFCNLHEFIYFSIVFLTRLTVSNYWRRFSIRGPFISNGITIVNSRRWRMFLPFSYLAPLIQHYNYFKPTIFFYRPIPCKFVINFKTQNVYFQQKKKSEINFLNPFKFRDRSPSSLLPEDCTCTFTSGDHLKHYHPLFTVYQVIQSDTW